MGEFCTVQAAASKKRKRASGQNESPDTEVLLPDGTDDNTKPRRVNPLHLAARLGPDLVREMEVHIKPGAYMPSFSIRKDLQERYNVDRRHLYDYFHSRGLRVAKEERFNNLTRSRMQKAQLAASGAEAEVCGFAFIIDYSLIILQEFGFHPTCEDKPEATRQGETYGLSSPDYECSSFGSERDRKYRPC